MLANRAREGAEKDFFEIRCNLRMQLEPTVAWQPSLQYSSTLLGETRTLSDKVHCMVLHLSHIGPTCCLYLDKDCSDGAFTKMK